MNASDKILHRGLFTTLDRLDPTASAVGIKDGVLAAVGHDEDVMKLAGPSTEAIDLEGRRALPGLIDNHLHIISGRLNFNRELRLDGICALADAIGMLKKQVAVTPPPQSVRCVGGFAENQFAEKRLPTVDELNAVAPDTPVFILHLYDRATLNAAALRTVGYTNDTRSDPWGKSFAMPGPIPPRCCGQAQYAGGRAGVPTSAACMAMITRGHGQVGCRPPI
jgi:predicted amidohydrolase YtcJ